MLTLLLGTNNRSKVAIISSILDILPMRVIAPADLNLEVSVVEDGASLEENAVKKARAFYQASGLPTFAVDAGLVIAGLPQEEQPGMYVRRILGAERQEASDLEMLEHYIAAIRRMGGSAIAHWTVGAAIADRGPDGQIRLKVRAYHFDARLTTQPSPVRLPGLPLSSLMIDQRLGRYFSEIDHREREDALYIRAIVREYLEEQPTAWTNIPSPITLPTRAPSSSQAD